MQKLAIISQKGGSGKSTIAVHLAVLAEQEGESVLLADLDPQRSAGDWYRARQARSPAVVETNPGDLGALLTRAAGAGATLAILDTPPHNEPGAVATARMADRLLIPVRPSILDMRAVRNTVAIARELGSPAAFVLNSCPPARGVGEASVTVEARRGLAQAYGLPVAPVAITQRAALSHALIDGRAVTEFDPASKAAIEICALWNWLETWKR
jgi:chromosome partitioning protein